MGITPTPFKIIPEQAVATAPRYHAGLKPDERVGILQVGEIVLPKEISESLLAASEEQVIQIHNYLDGREVSVNVIRRIERDSTLRSRYRRGLGVK